MKNKNLLRIVAGTALILLIPVVAMQFTNQVNWDETDFIVIGALLLGTGFTYELLASKVKKPVHRIAIGGVLLLALLWLWAELAVGIFTNWGS